MMSFRPSLRCATLLITLLAPFVWGCDSADHPTAPPKPIAQVFPPGTEVEPNSTCLLAQDLGQITLPVTLDGSLDGSPLPFGDVDFFRFAGPPNTVVRIDLQRVTLGDPYLGFFDSGCNLIAANDDGGGNLNSRLVIPIPADGVFVLGVTRCCDGGFDQGGSGAYQLTIQEIVPPPNDAFASATTVPLPLPFSDIVDMTQASTEPGEPSPTCGGFATGTAWYSFTPTETQSISGSIVNTQLPTVLAVYTGNSLGSLTAVGCNAGFGERVTFRAAVGTTYYFQVGGQSQGGQLEFRLEVPPPPVANFGFSPFDPTVFDVVQFFDFSFDPGGAGIASQAWELGDGTSGTGCCPTHRYAADGDYAVGLTVTTVDGRTGSAVQTVHVRTHDVAIIRFAVPQSASAGQTRRITVGVNSKRYAETVEVQLLKSVPGGFQFVGSLVQSVPVRSANRATDFNFTYTFTGDDARVGKVTFKAVAFVSGARDALPADNEAIAPPTKVNAMASP